MEALVNDLIEMREQEALEKAKELLDKGTDPIKLLEAC
jgi:methanogenic corrinoid protein MtbC1